MIRSFKCKQNVLSKWEIFKLSMDKKENSSLVELEVNKRKEIYQIQNPNKKQD